MVGRKDFYDVFLSHHSADKPVVEALARRLEDEAGLHPFFDAWSLIPGTPWQEALEQAMKRSQTCAVCIGPGGMGPWENAEMRMALDRGVTHEGFRVLPVFLPGAPPQACKALPPLLTRMTWIDFRSAEGIKNPAAFRQLVAGIRGEPPGREGFCGQSPQHVCPVLEAPESETTRTHVGNQVTARMRSALHSLTRGRWARHIAVGVVCLAGIWAVSPLSEVFSPVSGDMYGRVEATDLSDLHVELLDARGVRLSAGRGAVDSVHGTFVLWYSRWQRPQQFRIVAPGCPPQIYEIEPTQLRTGRGITLPFDCQKEP